MEEVKLYVELVGVDPASGADIRIARRESLRGIKILLLS